jgi:hydrogenase maturation protein HypF
MAENGIHHKVIGVAFDGLGYGDDGNFWGGEFFVADLSGYERAGHLDYVPMPGGEQAIKEPWRMAISYLYRIYGENLYNLSHLHPLIFINNETKYKKSEIILKMISQKINAPLTSSMGRLFDGVASIIGLQHIANYEGQAAIRLELIADVYTTSSYPFEININDNTACNSPVCIIRWQKTIESILDDLKNNISKSLISAKFHNSIIEIVLHVCRTVRDNNHLNDVVLSGGVFQNNFLLRRLVDKLNSNNFKVYFNEKVPCNDGGISLGQAVIASERYRTCA